MNAAVLFCHAAVACGLLWHAAGAPSSAAFCGDRNGTAATPACGLRRALPAHDARRWWTASPGWYRTGFVLAGSASAVCVALTLTAYALVLNQQDVSNYVRHYLACLLLVTLVGLADQLTSNDVSGDHASFCTYN